MNVLLYIVKPGIGLSILSRLKQIQLAELSLASECYSNTLTLNQHHIGQCCINTRQAHEIPIIQLAKLLVRSQHGHWSENLFDTVITMVRVVDM